MKKTTRPKERIYFNFLPAQTIDDGILFTFYAIDDYSQFAFLLETTKELSFDFLLQQIKKLMKHKDFKSSPKKPFTLVCCYGIEIENQIKTIIEPHKGEVIFDIDMVIAKTQNFVNEFNRS